MEEHSSSDSADSDTEMDDRQEILLKEEVSSLKTKLSQQPNLYDLHIQLINVLRRLGDLDELRVARENMHKVYPLSPELWLDWIKDERQIATTEDEKRQIECLFKRAIEDYDDVSIWLEYCLFAIGNLQPGCVNSLRATEAVFDLAVCHQGLNVVAGTGIWEMYRDFQSVLLSQQESVPSQSTDNLLRQMDKLYQRQLAIPLLGMESTMESYKEFLRNEGKVLHQSDGQPSSDVPEDCLRQYEKALSQLELLIPFEDRINPVTEQTQSDVVSAWTAYLKWVISYPHQKRTDGAKSKDKTTAEPFSPNYICCLFERAITANCLVPTIWFMYIDYLDEKLSSDKGRLVRLLARAVRNCPWDVELWLRYALVSEHAVNDDLANSSTNGFSDQPNGSVDDNAFKGVEAIFEAALAVGLEQQPDLMRLWLAYCDYRLRRLLRAESSTQQFNALLTDLRATFDRANSSLRKMFRHQADPEGLLVHYQSLIEAKYAKDTGAARSLWSHFMQQSGNGAQGRFWLSYLQFERDWGDAKHFHRICRMAINSISPAPGDNTFAQLLRIGCEAGLPVSQYLELEARVRSRVHGLQERVQSNTTDRPQQQQSMDKMGGKLTPSKKRPPEATTAAETAPKKLKPSAVDEKRKEPSKKTEHPVESSKAYGEHVEHDPSRDDRTVFVSNLDFSTTEDELRRTFESCGTLSSVRLVRDYAGRSKGYAYVEFEETKSAAAALEKDRQPVASLSEADNTTDSTTSFSRPMFVSRCDPHRSKSAGFHYSAGKVEPEKLFVRNLDKHVTAQELEKLFGEHGKVVSVRLATYRNGAPKGHAYVEFADADQASRALVATDGSMVGGKTISVAISNPPVRTEVGPSGTKRAKQTTASEHLSLDQKARSHGRTQLAFLPRAINRNAAAKSESVENPEPSPANMKSNEDFRKMFLS